jgi:hypothetical protein
VALGQRYCSSGFGHVGPSFDHSLPLLDSVVLAKADTNAPLSVAYECYPAPVPPSIHEVFLAGWGMPIGELFDLRELSAACTRVKQWTFLFTSMVLNIEGGIASPPNAQAIL